MVWRDCSGMDRCYECGSNYRVTTDLHVRSTYQVFNQSGMTYDETLTKDITQEVEWLCVDTDPQTGRCNTSTMRDTRTTTFNATARFTVNEGSPPVRRYIDLDISRTGGTGVVDGITPGACGQILRFWQLIETPYIGAPPSLSSLTTAENILYMPVRGNAVTSQTPGDIMRTQCDGTFYVPTYFPASQTLSTETRRTWSVAFNGSSGSVTYTYDRKTYAWPSGQQPYLASHNVATMTRNFQFHRVARCAPDAPLGCNDPLRRKRDDASGIGNGAEDIDGILAP